MVLICSRKLGWCYGNDWKKIMIMTTQMENERIEVDIYF